MFTEFKPIFSFAYSPLTVWKNQIKGRHDGESVSRKLSFISALFLTLVMFITSDLEVQIYPNLHPTYTALFSAGGIFTFALILVYLYFIIPFVISFSSKLIHRHVTMKQSRSIVAWSTAGTVSILFILSLFNLIAGYLMQKDIFDKIEVLLPFLLAWSIVLAAIVLYSECGISPLWILILALISGVLFAGISYIVGFVLSQAADFINKHYSASTEAFPGAEEMHAGNNEAVELAADVAATTPATVVEAAESASTI